MRVILFSDYHLVKLFGWFIAFLLCSNAQHAGVSAKTIVDLGIQNTFNLKTFHRY